MDGREVPDRWVIVEMESCNSVIRERMGGCVPLERYEKSDTVKQWIFQGMDIDKHEESIRCEGRRGM